MTKTNLTRSQVATPKPKPTTQTRQTTKTHTPTGQNKSNGTQHVHIQLRKPPSTQQPDTMTSLHSLPSLTPEESTWPFEI
jgi:hypothetical protein